MEWKCNVYHDPSDSSTMKFIIPVDSTLSKEEIIEVMKKNLESYFEILIFEEHSKKKI